MMHILLVEDNQDLGDAVATRLEQLGHTVLWLQDGDEVVATIRLEQFDALVLDLMLPNKSGLEIIKHLRGSGSVLPIVVITARSEIDDKVSLFDLGADDYLVKPFDVRELVARLTATIRRTNGIASNTVHIGNASIDMNAHKLVIGGETVECNRREFNLLQILVNHLDKAVAKETLMNRLFDIDDEVSFNALEVYISRLRRKLRKANIEISTLRGFGYRVQTKNGTSD
ncbi:response regulator transcription factor [uncultured Bartonella sp.]|uniref:response regulator transcription factor n=1 Tax=uncultured Bartonella sp. TaxID=104108 RepID=UPI0025DD097B|nr:response regulator transcription factor [uncultured Bartonella sp.]